MQLFKVGEWIDRERGVPEADHDAVPPQRHQPRARHLPRPGRDARDLPGLRESAYRIQLFGDEIEAIQHFDPLTGEILDVIDHVLGLAGDPLRDQGGDDRARRGPDRLRAERAHQVARGAGQAARGPPARCSAPSTTWRCCRSSGFCPGIENYSRILDGRAEGAPVHADRLLPRRLRRLRRRVAPDDPADRRDVRGRPLAQADLVDYGFRLPSAIDNRPLKFDEFLSGSGRSVCVSATPGRGSGRQASAGREQIVRPTGIVDPRSRCARPATRSTT